MDVKQLPDDLDACHQLIANLQSEVALKQQALDSQATELVLKDKLLEEQAHSVVELKSNKDRLAEKVTELNLTIEKLLQQLYGRKSERRIDGVGQLLLDLGEEATPEVVSALEDAIREAEQIVEAADEEQKKRRAKRPRKDNRKFPEHFPRYERIVDLPEDRREGLKFVGYDEVESLELIRSELCSQDHYRNWFWCTVTRRAVRLVNSARFPGPIGSADSRRAKRTHPGSDGRLPRHRLLHK